MRCVLRLGSGDSRWFGLEVNLPGLDFRSVTRQIGAAPGDARCSSDLRESVTWGSGLVGDVLRASGNLRVLQHFGCWSHYPRAARCVDADVATIEPFQMERSARLIRIMYCRNSVTDASILDAKDSEGKLHQRHTLPTSYSLIIRWAGHCSGWDVQRCKQHEKQVEPRTAVSMRGCIGGAAWHRAMFKLMYGTLHNRGRSGVQFQRVHAGWIL